MVIGRYANNMFGGIKFRTSNIAKLPQIYATYIDTQYLKMRRRANHKVTRQFLRD